MKTRGMTLIEMLIVLGLMSVLVLGMAAYFTSMGRAQQQAKLSAAAQLIQSNVLETLRHPKAWTFTLGATENASFECVRNGTDCGAVRAVDESRWIVVKDSANQDFLKTARGAGFTADGRACDGFPGVACPFRATVSWHAMCSESECVDPQFELEGRVLYDDGTKSGVGVNANKYSFIVLKSHPHNASGGSAELLKMCQIYEAIAGNQATMKVVELMGEQFRAITGSDVATASEQMRALCAGLK